MEVRALADLACAYLGDHRLDRLVRSDAGVENRLPGSTPSLKSSLPCFAFFWPDSKQGSLVVRAKDLP